jgi:hypothetical protein
MQCQNQSRIAGQPNPRDISNAKRVDIETTMARENPVQDTSSGEISVVVNRGFLCQNDMKTNYLPRPVDKSCYRP